MTKTLTRWDAAEHLLSKEEVQLYPETCVDEDPGDCSLIRAALREIARVRNMSQLARKIGMSRERHYKALSERGDPSLTTMMSTQDSPSNLSRQAVARFYR